MFILTGGSESEEGGWGCVEGHRNGPMREEKKRGSILGTDIPSSRRTELGK